MLLSSLLAAALLCIPIDAIPTLNRNERRKINAIKYGTPRKQSFRQKQQLELDLSRQNFAASTSNETTSAASTSAPFENIWRGLSNDEAASVIKFLHGQESLNLTASVNATSWDNHISVLDVVWPKKADALKYLSSETGKPERYARATIIFGATWEPYIEDYIVGPLPISDKTTVKPDTYYTTKGIARQPIVSADDEAVSEFVYGLTTAMSDIIFDLTGQSVNGSEEDTGEMWGIDPLWIEDGEVVNWVTLWAYPSSIFDGETLLPQGLFLKIYQTGRDSTKWREGGWLWDNIYYENSAAFREAWAAGKVNHLTPNVEYDVGGVPWIGTDKPEGVDLPLDDLVAPQPVAPGGARYTVDVANQYASWGDWSFYWTYHRDAGLRLWDVKFKNTTIIYELGLEEAIAHYAGNDPAQSGTSYLDTYYGFGPYAFQLIQGYDCPSYATYVNSTFHADELSTTHPGSICLFEFDNAFPIQHHTMSKYASATKNIDFTIRSISTVGNYDYMFSYTFKLDGSLETNVRASGYIQSAYYAHNQDYGYQINAGLSGSMHDHALTFKMDLDISGQKNSLAVHSIVPVEKAYPWSNGKTRSTMMLQKGFVETEDDGKINWPENGEKMYVVQNTDDLNPWGEARGYRIFPGSMTNHLTITKSDNLKNSQNFATHHLYVTKHHENEQRCASALNSYDVADPVIDFDKYFNSESLLQEDLVLWAVCGMHHVPHTGDLPNTVFTTATASVVLAPHNYFLSDVSRQTKQQVRITYNATVGEVTDLQTFNQTIPSGDYTIQPVDLESYQGDVKIRKFPYDPLDPYADTESIV